MAAHWHCGAGDLRGDYRRRFPFYPAVEAIQAAAGFDHPDAVGPDTGAGDKTPLAAKHQGDAKRISARQSPEDHPGPGRPALQGIGTRIGLRTSWLPETAI